MKIDDPVKRLDLIISQLGEFFDHIQIMATWDEDGTTKTLHRGRGNWHARQGMAHDFIQQEIAQENAKQISENLNPPPD